MQLQDEAACTLNCIDKCGDAGFEEIFINKVDFASKFDSCLRYYKFVDYLYHMLTLYCCHSFKEKHILKITKCLMTPSSIQLLPLLHLCQLSIPNVSSQP